MASNLAKSPLMALFFASILYFLGVFIPFSEGYLALYAGFSMPLTGYLYMIAFALWISLTAALVFGASEKKAAASALMLMATLLGVVWAIPMIEPLLFGPKPGQMETMDTIYSGVLGIACAALSLILAVLVYETSFTQEDGAKQRHAKYKLNALMLVIKMICLPLIYCVLFFVAWYFLNWTNPEVRAFYEGSAEVAGIIPGVVNVLLYDTWMFYAAIIKGLAYGIFALPLLFLFPGKRIVFILTLTFSYLAGAVQMLIPTPYMPDTVRMSACIYNAVLLFVFGALAGFLLHTSFTKVEAEPIPELPSRPRAGRQNIPLPAAPPAPAANPEPAPPPPKGKR